MKYEYYINNEKHTTDNFDDINFDKLHNDNGPAYIKYDNDVKIAEIWYINNKIHRDNKPAVIHYNINGDIAYEAWYINGINHNEQKPDTWYYDNGNINSQLWYKNNKLIKQTFFNEDGSMR